MRKILFVCGTNYSLLNIVNVILNGTVSCEMKPDLILFHRTKDMESTSQRLRKTGLFENIYDFCFIDELTAIPKIGLTLFPKIVLPRYALGNVVPLFQDKYSIIVSQSIFYAQIVCTLSDSREIYLVEEGLSSYTGRTVDKSKRSKGLILFWKIAKRKRLQIVGELLNRKQFYMGPSEIEIKDIGDIAKNNLELLKEVFGYTLQKRYKGKQYIYLGAELSRINKLLKNSETESGKTAVICRNILLFLFENVDRNLCVYRKHPIEQYDKVLQYQVVVDAYNENWELIAGNEISESQVLISFFSTAAFTPKLLFDKEPYVLFLYKLIHSELYNADEVVERLKSIYRRPEKIFIPKSKQELINCIARIRELTC